MAPSFTPRCSFCSLHPLSLIVQRHMHRLTLLFLVLSCFCLVTHFEATIAIRSLFNCIALICAEPTIVRAGHQEAISGSIQLVSW